MEAIIITGPCGIGKTTLAKAWAKRKNGAIIECDYFTEWIFDSSFPRWNEEEERFVANLTVKVAHEYLLHPMPVAMENVWSPLGITILVNQLSKLKPISSIKVIRLDCEPVENHRRDRLRPPEDQMRDRVDVVRKELDEYFWPEYLHRLETTHLSVEETIDRIETFPPVTS